MTAKSILREFGQGRMTRRAGGVPSMLNRLQRCYERREEVIDAFFDLADAIITVRSLIRPGMDRLPMGWPSGQATVITHLSARALNAARDQPWL